MCSRVLLSCLLLLLISGCGRVPTPTTDLLESRYVGSWKVADIDGHGDATAEANLLTLEAGKPMTGMRFHDWTAKALPLTDYEVTFEAQRVKGNDLFAAMTFPVRSINTCATLVLGGWGGGLVGISSIDELDASENSTRSEQNFSNGTWYRVRLEVSNTEIKAWIDDRLVVNTSIKGRKISLRPGDIEQCAPFGFATYGTTGQIRELRVKAL